MAKNGIQICVCHFFVVSLQSKKNPETIKVVLPDDVGPCCLGLDSDYSAVITG